MAMAVLADFVEGGSDQTTEDVTSRPAGVMPAVRPLPVPAQEAIAGNPNIESRVGVSS